MNNAGLVSLLSLFLGLTVFFARPTPSLKVQAIPYQPLEGTLFKGKLEALEKSDVPFPSIPKSVPKLGVLVKDPRQFGLPSDAKEFLAEIIPEADAKAELGPVLKKPVHVKSHKKQMVVQPAEQTPVLDAPQKTVSEHMTSMFNNLDAALNASETAFPLNNHFNKGGVTFQLTLIGKWNGFYLLKYSLANDEESEFFIASVWVATGPFVLQSEYYMPFSCLPHSSVVGIIKFPIEGMANKRLRVVLEESGGKYLKLEIKDVDYKF